MTWLLKNSNGVNNVPNSNCGVLEWKIAGLLRCEGGLAVKLKRGIVAVSERA